MAVASLADREEEETEDNPVVENLHQSGLQNVEDSLYC